MAKDKDIKDIEEDVKEIEIEEDEELEEEKPAKEKTSDVIVDEIHQI